MSPTQSQPPSASLYDTSAIDEMATNVRNQAIPWEVRPFPSPPESPVTI